MERRNLLILGLASVGLLAVSLSLFLPKSEEEVVAEQLHGLAASVGFSEPIVSPVFFGSALADRLEPYVAERVEVQIDEVTPNAPNERGKLAIAAAMALSRYGSLDVSLSDLTIELHASGARARAVARVSATEGGRVKVDDRPVRFDLQNNSGHYRVTRVLVASPDSIQ